MTQIRMRTLLVLGLLSSTAAVTAVSAETSDAGGKSLIFFDAPAPEALAELLFPKRYRAAEPKDASKSGNTFDMMINFHFDSTEIKRESEPLLNSVGEMLGMETVAGRSIVVEGHSDATGAEAYNQTLSEARADSIKQYLVDKFGIAPKRLVSLGKGERELYSKSEPDAAVNRRVTFRPAKKLVLK